MYLSVQAALAVTCVVVSPDADIANRDNVHTVADSAEPTGAYPV